MARLWRDICYTRSMYTPRFTITPQINTEIAHIERLKAAVDRSRILPTKEVVLRRRAAIEATRSSTGIEGNPLNVTEVGLVLSGQKISASERFITEVINYKKALSYVEKRSQNQNPIHVDDMLTLHAITMRSLLPKAKAGRFRKTPIYIVDLVGGRTIVKYQGPKSQRVPSLIDELLSWFTRKNQPLHPLLVAGILHYEFVSIHPFADGNGRVTRLLTLLYLFQSGYSFRKVIVPDSYYFEDRQKYYQALSSGKTYTAQRSADLTLWLSYFIHGLYTAAKDISEKIAVVSLSDDRGKVMTLTSEDYQIIDIITTLGSVSIEDIISTTKIFKRTAQRRLSRLVQAGILAKTGKGRSTLYKKTIVDS